MRKINIALTLSAGLAGWAVLAADPISLDQNRSLMEDAVRAQLRDPSSAAFRNITEGSAAICGEVNGTNAFGGAAGFRPFVYITGVVLFEPDQPLGTNVREQTDYLSNLAEFTRAQQQCRE